MVNEIKIDRYFPKEHYREYQRETIIKAIEAFDSGKKHVIIAAPTGSGKSAIAYTIAKYYGNAYISTTQKSLQKQYCDDFSLPELYGKSNYKCVKFPSVNCDTPLCEGNKCSNCPYLIARSKCLANDVSILNYSLLFALKTYANTENNTIIPTRAVFIADEAHHTESEIINFIGLDINPKLFKTYDIQLIPLPPKNASDLTAIKWLNNSFIQHLTNKLTSIQNALDTVNDDKTKSTLSLQSALLDKFICQINRLFEFMRNDGKIAINITEENITFKPIVVDLFAKEFLSEIATRMIHTSATMPSKDVYCKSLGLNENDVEYITVPSTFPVDNRRVYFKSIGSMAYNQKQETMPKMAKAIDTIITKLHKNERGIIHTGNYELAHYLYDNINTNRFILPKGKDRDLLLQEFFTSDRNDLILLSPSLMEGLDLADSNGKFGIIAKLPFANLNDTWVKKKMELCPGWYESQTILNIEQSCGRIVRSKVDKGINYIFDSTFNHFYLRNKFKFSKHFNEALII